MSEIRPNADLLLQQQPFSRGRLKIFFGAFAGVGKTYAMLSEARRLRLQGLDVLAGLVETHGRDETAALLEGLELLPPKALSIMHRRYQEFDIDAVLARHPALVLVDELAHSNAPGCRHRKRWQDVKELLDAGIDVFTTVNVQHLESLNDLVGGITGIKVSETLPDSVFYEADEVVLVDLPPDDLMQRMREGKIYLSSQVERAIENFFNRQNLTALRELALNATAERLEQRRRQDNEPGLRGGLLLGLTHGEQQEKLIRHAMRLAKRLNCRWYALHVETPEAQQWDDSKRQQLQDNLKLAESLGAETATLVDHDICHGLLEFAGEHRLERILIGHHSGKRQLPWRRELGQRLRKRAADEEIISLNLDQATKQPKAANPIAWPRLRPANIALALGMSAFCTLLGYWLAPWFHATNIVMIYLLGTVLLSLRLDRMSALLATLVNVACFDLFFVEPRFSFSVADAQYLMTFFAMAIVSIAITQLTHTTRIQAQMARQRELRTYQLFEMSQQLGSAQTEREMAAIAQQHIGKSFAAAVAVLKAEEQGTLLLTKGFTRYDSAIAKWSIANNCAAGAGTDTLPNAGCYYQPVAIEQRVLAMVVLEPVSLSGWLAPEQQRLLNAFVCLLAQALERLELAKASKQAQLNVETEKMRSTMLSSLSHDLRTPLTLIRNQSDSLVTSLAPFPEQCQQARQLAQRIGETIRLTNNVMEMIRLESCHFILQLDWQDLEEILGVTLRQLEPRTQIRLNIPAELPLIYCDGNLIQRVLLNLLENAFKYGPPKVQISISAQLDAEQFYIEVADNGPGLPTEDASWLFTKFERGNKECGIPGLGLGLAICQAIVSAHGGRIWAHNREQGGAVFTFSLPYVSPPEMCGEEEYLPEQESSYASID